MRSLMTTFFWRSASRFLKFGYRTFHRYRGAFPKAYVPVCVNAFGLKLDTWPVVGLTTVCVMLCPGTNVGRITEVVLREADCIGDVSDRG